jgi:hypothetical protein
MFRALCLSAWIAAWSAAPLFAQAAGEPAAPPQVPTPTDVKPGSINLEDVPYPHLVSYLTFLT